MPKNIKPEMLGDNFRKNPIEFFFILEVQNTIHFEMFKYLNSYIYINLFIVGIVKDLKLMKDMKRQLI